MVQGKLEWKDFNIVEAANGTGKPVTKQIDVAVTENALEIRLYWAGKGTTCIPKKGTYGPLISAISACHSGLSIYDPLNTTTITADATSNDSFMLLFGVEFSSL